MKKNIFFLLFSFLMYVSCSSDPTDKKLTTTLLLAESNRGEMETVLSHYAQEPQKLAAAKYLISNMPGHYSYSDTSLIIRYAHIVDSIIESMQKETDYNTIRDSINCYAQRLGIDTLKKVEDCQLITSEFLIKNIDSAFDDWKNGPWAAHVNFEDFCEWILPYKVEEGQPLDNWRSVLKNFKSECLDEIHTCDQLSHSPLAAAEKLNNAFTSVRLIFTKAIADGHFPEFG